MLLSIPTPPEFSYKRTALSHGWYDLPPFSMGEDYAITRTLDPDDGRDPVTVKISEAPGAINVDVPRRRLAKRDAERIARDVRHMFRLDDDMSGFYELMAAEPAFAWVAPQGAGRLLRSPTVYEDLVKSLCTTNCSWALTKIMVTALVDNLGRLSPEGGRAFPTPAAMAEAPESFYREVVRAGYRAPYLKELAQRAAAGELDVEGWLTSELTTDQLKREMKRVKGVGDYAAENLLKLVGRYDVLALDSWVRATFARLHNRGRACDDQKITRHYARFRGWRGLALWCDITRDWIEEKEAGAR